MKLLKKSTFFAFLAVAVPVVSQAAEGILDYDRFMRDIEPIITTRTFTSPGPTPMTCVSCHGVSTHPAFTAYPIVVGQSRDNFTETARRVSVADPDVSLLLLKPLALAAGGVPHGVAANDGGEQFPTTQDSTFATIQQWIVDATRASVGARVSRSAAYPNPFRFNTNIVYFLTTEALDVEVTLFSMEGHVELGDNVRIGANCVIRNARIASGARIHEFTHIDGEKAGASVGEGALVGPFARLRPGAQLGAEVHIGNFVEVKNSTLAAGAKANHLAYLGDATVGERVNYGAGSITANYDGANKHRTEIGPDVHVGSNCVLIAPVTIGAGATIGGGSTITKPVGAGELAVARGKQVAISGWTRPAKKR
jgi:acetyltransferase-like isoleucine patch superfamily enzyme